MGHLATITDRFAKGEGVTLTVSPETIDHARDLIRLAQRRTGRDVATTVVGDKMIVEIVGGA